MAETRYLVFQEKTCTKCNGSCFVQHPAWEEYWKSHNSFEFGIEESKKWFEDNGFLTVFSTRIDGVPDEEIICPECQGRGSTVSQIELREAMQDLGFISSELVNSDLVKSK